MVVRQFGTRRVGRWTAGHRGFTLIEMVVYLVFGGLVVAAIHQLVVRNQQDFVQQRLLVESGTLRRSAMQGVLGEFRALSPAGGDLSIIEPSRIRFRQYAGSGVVCGVVQGALQPTYTLALVSGNFRDKVRDSVLVLSRGAKGAGDDSWRVLKTKARAFGSFPCDYAAARNGTFQLIVTGDTAGIRLGAPMRGFRSMEVAAFSKQGEWYLGSRLGTKGQYTLLGGPINAPADSGLLFLYRDADGLITTNPADVTSIEILIRAKRKNLYTGVPISDSLRTTVNLRG